MPTACFTNEQSKKPKVSLSMIQCKNNGSTGNFFLENDVGSRPTVLNTSYRHSVCSVAIV